MRNAYRQAASPAALFFSKLESSRFRNQIAQVVLLKGDLLVPLPANSEKTHRIELRKGQPFLVTPDMRERIKGIVNVDGSTILIDKNGELKITKLKTMEPVKIFAAAAVKPTCSSKTPEVLALYERIVDHLDRQALGEYYEASFKRLRQFAWKIVRNDDLAEEAVQHAFMSIHETMDKKSKGLDVSFCQESWKFDTYFHSVVKNAAKRTHLLELKDGHHLSYETVNYVSDTDQSGVGQDYLSDPELGVRPPPGYNDPLENLLESEKQARLEGKIAILERNPNFSLIMMIGKSLVRDEELEGGRTYAEIAADINVPVNTVKTRTFHQREILKRSGVPDFNLA